MKKFPSHINQTFILFALSLCLITGFPLKTLADAEENNVEATLTTSHSSVTPGQSFYLALRLDHNKGWHTYWQNPGDSGQPPEINWQETSEATVGDIIWPTPEVIETPPLMTYGYSDVVYLPIKVTAPDSTDLAKLTFNGAAHWLECKDICLPASAAVSATVNIGEETTINKAHHQNIERTILQRVPQEAAGWRMNAIYGEETVQLNFKPQNPADYKNTDFRFLPFEGGIIDNSAPQTLWFDEDTNTFKLQVERNTFTKNNPDPLKGILAYEENGPRAIKFSGEATNASLSTQPQNQLALGLLVALGLAFIGGLILNLMPCVLPVLALKITHMVTHAQKEAPWHHGVAFAAGVIGTFLLLAGVLIALQASGQALGWGFQLQNPVFILVLAIILLAVALDLMGLFEIGVSLSRLAGKEDKVAGKTGSFLTGVLATVVATPCTAPFMGSAMAFTLGQPASIVLLVFATLGLGLAAPYVILTVFPRLLGFIPKPGPWMITFKQILAFPILATILWLLWVLGGQVGSDGVLVGLIVLLVVAFALWLWGRFGQNLRASRRRAVGVFIVSLILVFGSAYIGALALKVLDETYSTQPGNQLSTEHTMFSPGLPEELQQQNQASFVIFTADWCITCKVNERVVIQSASVQKAFAEQNIKVITADWTRQDDAISQTLKKHGRAGVPFYLYYPPTPGAKPEPLPELLTQDIVLRTIKNK